MNWNVRLAYFQSVASAIGFGIIQTAFAVFVTTYLAPGANSNTILGNLFTTSGLASTIFVFPSGYFADKYRRDLLIRISVIFGVLSQFTLIFSLGLINTPNTALNVLFISQTFGGLGWGLSGPAAQALIADSIEAGNRSRIFANMHLANLIASAAGPALAAGLTLIIGDTWEIETLQNLILFGAISALVAYIAFIFVSDKKAIKSQVETIQQISKINKEGKEDLTLIPFKTIEVKILNKVLFKNDFYYDVFIPTIIVISGIIIGFGAGATVAFFPVLFANPDIGYGLFPFFTYSIVAFTNIVTGFMGIVAQRMIATFGRIGSMFISQGLAIVCLLGIVVNLILYQNGLNYEVSVIVLVIFYISRNALMNASGPVSRSIVMDIVPSDSRAKWNSLETLAWGMFWSVSASIGGFIVDNLGFLYVFMFTATLYTLATLMLLIIKNRVPKESILARTYQLGKLKARNRVVMPSSTLGTLKVAEDLTGQLTTESIEFYRDTAKGGAGLIYLQPAFVSYPGKSRAYQIGIHEDYCIPRLREVVTQVHEYGALIGIRLTHAGASTRESLTGFQPLSPSNVTIPGCDVPKPLNKEEIRSLKHDFLDAAIRAAHSGFDIIEFSTYLDSHEKPDLFTQFISPKYNTRTDEYGGSMKNRTRFFHEIVSEIKKFIPPNLMLAFSLSLPPYDLTDDILEFIDTLKKVGIEMLNIDFSGVVDSSQVQFLRSKFPGFPLVLSGGFDIKSGENAIKQGQADFIGFEALLQKDKSFPQALR